jgi:hypothetical protein
MNLFLLNTMENNKPRKIGLIILGFFYYFLPFFKVLLKKKKENDKTVLGRFWPNKPRSRENSARARAQAILQKGPRASG